MSGSRSHSTAVPKEAGGPKSAFGSPSWRTSHPLHLAQKVVEGLQLQPLGGLTWF